MRYARSVRRFPLLVCAAAAAALVCSSPGTAVANGRFPEANALFFSDTDPDLVVLRVTFGLIVSHDRGQTWRWVCEKAVGTSGVEDPMYAVTPSGAIVGATFQGVVTSTDKGCSFGLAGGALQGLVFVDLAAKPTDKNTIVAFASSYEKQDDEGGILFQSQLFETKDGAKTWAPIGAAFDPYLLGETVDYAASDPDRVYVSAVRDPGSTPKAVLLTSKNHGASFDAVDVPLVDTERGLFIAAVDPTNADRVYLRTENATDKPSRLLVTKDGGKTFDVVYNAQGPLLGFALSKDGQKLWIGGPKDGVRVASTTDFAFQQKSSLPAQCLALNGDGLWACSSELGGFVAGLSKDDGATFQAKLHFCGIAGVVECPAGTPTADQCGPAFPQQQSTLGCEVDGGPSGDGGSSGDGGDADTPPGGGGSSCACDVAGSPTPLTALLAAFASIAAAATVAVRRRRR